MESEGEDLQEQEEVEDEADQEEKDLEEGAEYGGSSCESCASTILLPQKQKRRIFEIPEVSDDEEENERISKKTKNWGN